MDWFKHSLREQRDEVKKLEIELMKDLTGDNKVILCVTGTTFDTHLDAQVKLSEIEYQGQIKLLAAKQRIFEYEAGLVKL